jgi:vacuolar-type H+-ATPase subunit F/Vma7
MRGVTFIGDELTATGFRLTGVETLSPDPSEAANAFESVRPRAALVVLTAEYAAHIPAETLEAALVGEAPTVAVIPDVRARIEPPSPARRMKSILGIES